MLIHMDGFDLYTNNNNASDLGFQYAGWQCNISTTGGRYGQGAVLFNINGSFLNYILPTSQSTIWTGFAYQSTSTSRGAAAIMVFLSSSSNPIEATVFYNDNTSTWTLYRGEGSLLGSAVYSIGTTSYHWIEVYYAISSSVGEFALWIDNTEIISLTGVNNTQNGVTSFTGMYLGSDGSNSGWNPGYYDDWYILNTSGAYNTTRLGDSRIETLVPNSDTGPNNGTPSISGPHYAMVDGPQNNGGSTDYITITNTTGQEELFGENNLVSTPSVVSAVKVTGLAKKTDAGSVLGNTLISSGGQVAYSANNTPLLTSYSATTGIFEQDPNTSAAWTYTAVNASDAGFTIA